MQKKNRWIIALLVTGLILFLTVQGVVKPYLNKQKLVYEEQQHDPLTHDFSALLPYKNPYMGNAGNLSNLNHRLPLFRELNFTLQLYPNDLHAELHFSEPSALLDPTTTAQAFVYNVTANFALIDNLQLLTFRFPDQTYTFSRQLVEQWYDQDTLDVLQKEEEWESKVRSQLRNTEGVRQFIDQTRQAETYL